MAGTGGVPCAGVVTLRFDNIQDGTFPAWVRAFVERQRPQFPGGAVPQWAVEALRHAGIEL